MISVVVPTMWKYAPFVKFIQNLERVDIISEIIIIDNNHAECPKDLPFNTGKVKMFWGDNNTFVNPAWNFGVENSMNDNVCIINDDVIVDFKLFYMMDSLMTSDANFGTAGICPGELNFEQPQFVDGSIDIVPWQQDVHTSSTMGTRFGFGTLYFVKKSSWVTIPHEMKVYYGDDWVFETQLKQHKQNYLITNCLFHTPYAQTCSLFPQERINELMAQDGEIYFSRINTL